MMEDGIAKTTGGAEKFISFMEKELIPYVDSKYPASSFRILIGHSFGGLTVIYTLLNHVKLFNQYIALDPSMWWDEQKLVKQADSLLSNKTFKDNSLFIAVANTWNKEMNDVNQLKNDKTERTALTRPELTLIDHILANKQNKLRFEWKYYQKHNHMSVPPSGIYDGLKFLFKP
jgi:predicted alpha/beta superfamily hydrolase